jgi:Fic family protein
LVIDARGGRASTRAAEPRFAGQPFVYALPDEVLRATDAIARNASGQITISEQVTHSDTRDRYIVSSLIEEAITSSQLEGAATSHREAKNMLRTGRPPRDHGERMILNNYWAMEHIRELKDQPLTPELVLELHRIVTEGTLENPEYAGKLQDDDAQRVAVWGDGEQLLHRPPPVAGLSERLHAYLARKADEMRSVQSRLRAMRGEYNHRQLALLDYALRSPDEHFTVRSHSGSHRVSGETARQDLQALEHQGLLERFKISKQFAWRPAPDLPRRPAGT